MLDPHQEPDRLLPHSGLRQRFGRELPMCRFGERMHNDVGAVLDGADQVGRGHRVVDDERDAVPVRDVRQRGDIGDVAARVADRLGEDGLGAVVDQRVERGGVARIGEAGGDAGLRQRVREEVVGATVQRARLDDVVAALGDGLNGVGDGGLSGGQRERPDAAFERGHALFQHVLRRVHDACVDVARDFQVEQVCAVLRVVERTGHRLVNGHGDGAGGDVGTVAAVDGDGVEVPGGVGWVMCGSPAGVWNGELKRSVARFGVLRRGGRCGSRRAYPGTRRA